MDAIILDLGDDIKGDSQLEGYTDKIELITVSHSVSMQVTNDVSNTERTSGKAHVGEIVLTKFIDSSTPNLNSYCTGGKAIAQAKITVGRNAAEGNGQILPFYVITVDNVVFSSVSIDIGKGGKPVETVSLNFTKIKWEMTTQKSDGTKEGNSAAVWDMKTNKAGS